MRNTQTVRGIGLIVEYYGGVLCIPKEELGSDWLEGASLGERLKAGEDGFEELLSLVEEGVVDFTLEGVTSLKKVEGFFMRVDLGGYWSSWVWGESREHALEGLDEEYGIFDQYR